MGLHVCRNLLYTPLEWRFTGESLTILDFVRGRLFIEFGKFLFVRETCFPIGLTNVMTLENVSFENPRKVDTFLKLPILPILAIISVTL